MVQLQSRSQYSVYPAARLSPSDIRAGGDHDVRRLGPIR